MYLILYHMQKILLTLRSENQKPNFNRKNCTTKGLMCFSLTWLIFICKIFL